MHTCFLDAYILRSYNEEGVISECVICLLVARRKSASLLLRNYLPRTCHPQSNVLIRPNHSLYGLTTSCLQYTQNANWGVTASPLESLKCDSNQDWSWIYHPSPRCRNTSRADTQGRSVNHVHPHICPFGLAMINRMVFGNIYDVVYFLRLTFSLIPFWPRAVAQMSKRYKHR